MIFGILAFGSLRIDPGCEIKPKIVYRRCVITPFPVEFARYSCRSRGGAPTLVPVDSGGAQVKAEVFVLHDLVTLDDAKSMLWRRETHKTNSSDRYVRPKQPGRNNVLIKCQGFKGLEAVIYTDFAPSGKISNPNPRELAEKAIKSVKKAETGQDGITYLINAKSMGVVTPLISAYESEILELTDTHTLDEALQRAHNELFYTSVKQMDAGDGCL